MAAMSVVNRALQQIPKRAERQQVSELHKTFVDSGVADVLDSIDSQVLYGRRGTGKTHAMSYLATEASARGDVALYLDLRSVGSPDGILGLNETPVVERAARLLVDLLGQLHDTLINVVLDNNDLIDDAAFVDKADELLTSITSIRMTGPIGTVEEQAGSVQSTSKASVSAGVSTTPSIKATLGVSAVTDERRLVRETHEGYQKTALNFTDIARSLRDLGATLASHRVWLLLDEWSSIPRDLQPYLAEFLVRCVLPVQKFTVKIAAIEHQTRFRAEVDGRTIGIELGADMGAHVNLDDFLVYEGNQEQSREFFARLFYNHLHAIGETQPGDSALGLIHSANDLLRVGFTDKRAFDELARAAEGVPRDALYIAARAGARSGADPISVPQIRSAAHDWYQTDKSGALEGQQPAKELLNWIYDKVIGERKTRNFLVRTEQSRDPLLLALFDARVLHIIRKGYSAQDTPGVRYDIWGIDYGAYVDLLPTKNAPRGALLVESEDGSAEEYVDVVPLQDRRRFRRAILDLTEFYNQRT